MCGPAHRGERSQDRVCQKPASLVPVPRPSWRTVDGWAWVSPRPAVRWQRNSCSLAEIGPTLERNRSTAETCPVPWRPHDRAACCQHWLGALLGVLARVIIPGRRVPPYVGPDVVAGLDRVGAARRTAGYFLFKVPFGSGTRTSSTGAGHRSADRHGPGGAVGSWTSVVPTRTRRSTAARPRARSVRPAVPRRLRGSAPAGPRAVEGRLRVVADPAVHRPGCTTVLRGAPTSQSGPSGTTCDRPPTRRPGIPLRWRRALAQTPTSTSGASPRRGSVDVRTSGRSAAWA